MTVISPAIGIQGGTHSAQVFRQLLSALSGSPVQTFAGGISPTTQGGGHGVVGTGLLVAENGTPDMSVDVSAGVALITGTSSLAQGVYAFCNDATVNLSIATADATNARKDLICAQVRDDAEDAGGNNDARLHVITGTPAGSPADPSTEPGDLVLARVNVPALDTAITDAQIDDLRTYACATGGVLRCTSTTRPTGVARTTGRIILESDTGRLCRWNDTGWLVIGAVSGSTSYVAGATSGTTNGTTGDLAISFGVTFASAPTVLITPQISSNQQYAVHQPVASTTTGATGRLTVNDTLATSVSVTYKWVAFGVLYAP